jgi:hypothetical protein
VRNPVRAVNGIRILTLGAYDCAAGRTDATMTMVVQKPLKAALDGQISRRLFVANNQESTGIVRSDRSRWTTNHPVPQ